jgi:hypothetical protein
MAKTRKNSRHSHSLPAHAATFHGLNTWFEHEVEKLGWMVIAKGKGYDFKIAAYKKAIEQLIKSIEHVMKEYKDPDRIHDLKVLHMHACCLRDHVSKDF